MHVRAVCNNGYIKKKATLKECVGKYNWMTWFQAARIDIDATPQSVGRRRLIVDGLDKPAEVTVIKGQLKIS